MIEGGVKLRTPSLHGNLMLAVLVSGRLSKWKRASKKEAKYVLGFFKLFLIWPKILHTQFSELCKN